MRRAHCPMCSAHLFRRLGWSQVARLVSARLEHLSSRVGVTSCVVAASAGGSASSRGVVLAGISRRRAVGSHVARRVASRGHVCRLISHFDCGRGALVEKGREKLLGMQRFVHSSLLLYSQIKGEDKKFGGAGRRVYQKLQNNLREARE